MTSPAVVILRGENDSREVYELNEKAGGSAFAHTCSIVWWHFLTFTCQPTLFVWQKAGVPPPSFCLSTGMVLGIFAVLLVGGVISEALGWPFVFYIFGKQLASEICSDVLLRLCICVYFPEERGSTYRNVREAKYLNLRR